MLEAQSLWPLIEARANATPQALFAVDESDNTLDFDGYRALCESKAAGLFAKGIRAGIRVSWILPTRIDSLVLAGALARIGAVQNPILPIYGRREVDFVTRQTGAEFLIVSGTFRGVDFAAMATELAQSNGSLQAIDIASGLPDGDASTLPLFSQAGSSSPKTSLPLAQTASTEAVADDFPVRWIFYTSGTTSDPKGAMHTDATLQANALGMANALDLNPDDRSAMVFPVTHIGGIGWLFSTLLAGSGLIVAEAFHPIKTPPLLQKHGVTQAAAGTVFHQAYLDQQREQPDTPLFPRVRTFPGGAAPKPPQLHYDLVAEMGGVGIVSGYGLTECPIIAMNTTRCEAEKLAHTEGRANPPGAIMRIIKTDGTQASPGEEGEIRAFGPQLFKGYVDESLNEAALDEQGFFRTGDLGYLDAEGYITITGRLKDVIIRKGENISAQEIEDLLYQHPKVAGVAVIGLPDPASGERVCAIVQSVPNERFEFDEMVEFLASKQLMKQKWPEQLESIDEIPRNPAGKILKKDLRERFSTEEN